ncbi:MAG: transposase [Actinobacteria bacterium]|nr:transposase [Actinomycetota bacterium]MBU1944343.1 transposase [Actinomycetota bacterium]MBU2688328.1 transposase [Actinomycetota bacterium]
MPYPERQQYEGAIYHVISRGNGKQNIFLGERDRLRFLKILEEVTNEYRWLVMAYCLMGHHYHLLLETPEPNLAAGMQKLNGSYGTWFNRVHEKVGHVLQGRYRSPLVVRESHFVWLTKYIVLNPVRDGFVESPDKWPWSSYSFMVGREEDHPFLSPARVFSEFGSSRDEAASQYARYVTECLEESRQIAEEKKLTLSQLLDADSGGGPCEERIWRAYFVHHNRIADISLVAGVSEATVSRILRRYPLRDYFTGF